MKKLIVIALNTYRESIRDKIFYSLLLFAAMLLGFSMVLGNLSIGEPEKIIKDFGLGSISIAGAMIAVFIGIGMVYKEMDKRTIYVILSKPVERWQFLIGKYLGLSLTIAIEVVVMSLLLFVLCYQYTDAVPFELTIAIVPIYFELLLVLAFAIFFSSFSTSILSAMFTLSFFIIGHLTLDLKQLAAGTENVLFQQVTSVLFYVFPNLEALNFKAEVVHGLPISAMEVVLSLSYSLAYTILILLLAIFIFNRRDIK